MEKRLARFLSTLLILCTSWSNDCESQTVQVSLGNDTTLPCGINCTNLTATLTQVTSTNSYVLDSTISYSNHFAYTGGSSVSIPTSDDQFSSAIALPFNFCFYDNSYTNLYIGTNGIISFNSVYSGGTCIFSIPGPIPTNSYHPPSILPAFHDINLSWSGNINYYSTGTAPNRKFVINFSNVPQFGCTSVSTFQTVLYEGTNVIEFYIKDKPLCPGKNTICGIQKDGTTALAVPGRNATQWGASGMNKAFRFTPNGTALPVVQLLNAGGMVISTATPVPASTPGQQTATFNNICLTADSANYIVKVTYPCSNTIVYDTIKVKKLIIPLPTVTSPVNYCEGASATALTATGQNILWYSTATGGTGSTNAPVPNTSVPGTQVYYLSQTLNGCESLRDSIVVQIISSPAAPASSNSPICSGDSLKLYAGTIPGATYSWTGPASFSSTMQNPAIANAQAANSGTYSVTATLNGCTSSPTTTTVIIYPAPVITGVSYSDPTTCGGTDGSIILSGLTPNTTYTINYNAGTTPVTLQMTSSGSGTITIGNLSAGIPYTGITISINACPPVTLASVILNEPATPVITMVSNNGPLCQGDTLNLAASTGGGSGATYSWTGPNGFSSLQQNPSIANAGTAMAGTYTVTATANNCTSLPATTTVIINAVPLITGVVSSDPTACNASDGSISLSGLSSNVTYTVDYTSNGIPQTPVMLTADNSGLLTIPGLNAAVYANIQVTVNGCTSNIAGPVTLSDPPGPPLPVISNNGPLCSGASLNLTAIAAAGVAYNWTGPNNFTSTLQNPSIPNAQSIHAGTYSLTVSLNNCTSMPVTTNVIIHPTPAVVVSSNSPLCDGGNLTLSATSAAGAGYTWTGPNNFSASIQNVTINNITAAASGTYTVTASLNSCISDPDSVNVTVNPIPAAPTTADTTYCQFMAATALAATGQNLLWYITPAGSAGSPNAPIPNTATTGNQTWYVSQTINGCESQRTPVTVTVITQPGLPAVTSPVTYCQDQPAVPLNATGQNLLWYTAATGGTGSAVAPTPSTSFPGITTWYVTQSVSAGCESDRAAITVTVGAIPDTPITQSPVMYCTGDAALPLTAQGQNLKWYTSETGGTGTSTAPTPNTGVPGIINYYVSQAPNGCESGRSSIAVVVSEQVQADITLSDHTICQYDTIIASNDAANPSPTIYNWDFNGGSVITGTGSGPYQIRWNTEGTRTITLTVTNGSCTATDMETVMVRPSPAADFDIRDNACIGEVINIQAAWNSLNGNAFLWRFDGAEVLSGSGPGGYEVRWGSPGEKTVSLQIETNGCRSEVTEEIIKVHETPGAKIEIIQRDEICSGDTLLFKAQSAGTEETYYYVWTPAQFFPVNGLEEAMGIIKRTGTIHLTVTDPYGCSGADSLLVTAEPCCDISLPDAFTPNGDGRNDIFRVITRGNNQISSFKIANRWGQIIFETGDGRHGWDGTFGGEPQNMGTYFYFIRYSCADNGILEKKGEVTLVR